MGHREGRGLARQRKDGAAGVDGRGHEGLEGQKKAFDICLGVSGQDC